MPSPALAAHAAGAKSVPPTGGSQKNAITTNEVREVLHPPVTLANRVLTLIGVIAPFIGLLIAMYGLWGWGFSWVDLMLLVVMYIASGFGVTVGFHRLFTHRSFTTFRPVAALLGVLGSMAVEGRCCAGSPPIAATIGTATSETTRIARITSAAASSG